MKSAFSIPVRLKFFVPAIIWMGCAILLMLFGLLFHYITHQQRQLVIERARNDIHGVFRDYRHILIHDIIKGQPLDLSFVDRAKDLQGKLSGVWVVDGKGHLMGSRGEPIRTYLSSLGLESDAGSTMSRIARELPEKPALFHCTIDQEGIIYGYFIAGLNPSSLASPAQWWFWVALTIICGVFLGTAVFLHLGVVHWFLTPMTDLKRTLQKAQPRFNNVAKPVTATFHNEFDALIQEADRLSDDFKSQQLQWSEALSSHEKKIMALDLTQRRLTRLNADLENIVEARTRELQHFQNEIHVQQQALFNAHQENSYLEERISCLDKQNLMCKWARSATHTLNNILTGLVSYPELILLDLPLDSPIRPKVQNILCSARNAATVVQDLLALTESDGRRMRPININAEVIEEWMHTGSFKELRHRYPDIAFETDLSRDLMKIKGHGNALKKMLFNMMAFVFATENTGVQVTTENRYVDQPIHGTEDITEGDYVVLRIMDDAPLSDSVDLWQRFNPLDTRKTGDHGYSDMCLAVVWAIVKDHRGCIDVRHQPGNGNCFDFYFPVDRRETDAENTTIAIDRFMGSGETVLVIDDIKEQRQIAATLLTRLNYKVHAVESGERAVAYLKTRSVDILVLDMIMDPGMDGLDTYIQIIEQHPGQKAVIASGFAENERVQRAQRLGAGPYIRKPYTLEKIALGLKNELVQ